MTAARIIAYIAAAILIFFGVLFVWGAFSPQGSSAWILVGPVSVGLGLALTFAEPDHASRLDFPEVLARLGERQTEALAAQGADVCVGRKLRALCSAAGLGEITAGVLGGEWIADSTPGPSTPEWETLRADLAGRVPAADLGTLEDYDRDAWQRGERVLFVPTFFAAGRASYTSGPTSPTPSRTVRAPPLLMVIAKQSPHTHGHCETAVFRRRSNLPYSRSLRDGGLPPPKQSPH